MSLVKFAAIFVAAATVSQISLENLSRQTAIAQSFGDVPDSFPVPDSLPEGTTLKLDGSTSMRFTNEAVEKRFEEQYANVDVELDASRTDEAFEALINGDIDILATGRPLTDEEKAQGVVEVPLEQREKLAIILGPDNPLPIEDDPATPEIEGNLTFEQFARMFRGEITNWSEVGGPDLPIRFVDRPDYSDTRRALSTYTVFEGKPFETGSTADPVEIDETDDVVSALGNDGIGYAVVSQVEDRDDVRIISMHQTLPDDPRYPYSQYRAFVYKEDAGPAALAFMGFATTAPGQEVFASAPAPAEAPPVAAEPPAAAPAAEPAAAGKGGFPLWLLPLLAIPLLGALLWWLLKGAGTAPAAAPVAAAGAAATGAAAAAAGATPRMVLTARDCRNAYAYWEIPQERLNETKRQGGEKMIIRIYDITGRSKNSPLPSPAAEYPCLEANPDLHLPIAVDDRSYCAEVGYLGKDNEWFPVAKSDPVRVPVCPKDEPVAAPAPGKSTPAAPKSAGIGALRGAAPASAALGGAALGGAALAGAAALGANKAVDSKAKTPVDNGRMILTPRSDQDAYAYWEIPQGRLADAQLQGGKTMVAKLYDVTDRPADAPLPEPVTQLECTEADMDAHFEVTSERDYVSEIGYQTASGKWLPLAKSNSVRIPADSEGGAATGKFPGAALGAAAAVATGAAAMGASVGASKLKADEATSAQSRIVITPKTSQKADVSWEVPDTAKSALKAEGGEAYQLRIHDVTDVELDRQSPNSTLVYDLSETDCDRTVPLPNTQSDYVAEVGYQTSSGDWLTMARSTPISPVQEDLSGSSTSPDALNMGIGAAGAAAGAAAAGGMAATVLKAQKSEPTPTDQSDVDTVDAKPLTQGDTQIVKVHSRNNAVMFDEGQLGHIESDVAVTHQLTPGIYTLRLRDGVFNYDADDSHPGEPFVLLWIHGGTVINQKTGVPVSSTWTTLNGYDDTLLLNVKEPVKLCAFFVDTYPDDNLGEVTLSVSKQSSNQ
ncbi:MAG: DUF4912 domain-containing protein [Leptolyngbyaceae cyanobacterium MAG.088]|nr:DUF4912 domain-containing protein [Leptolyngbyaceae cyanobacterium MAG.088]